MQKVITITIHTNASDVNYTKGQAFIDHTELNKLLAEGWEIKTHFISTPQGNSLPVITFILHK